MPNEYGIQNMIRPRMVMRNTKYIFVIHFMCRFTLDILCNSSKTQIIFHVKCTSCHRFGWVNILCKSKRWKMFVKEFAFILLFANGGRESGFEIWIKKEENRILDYFIIIFPTWSSRGEWRMDWKANFKHSIFNIIY